MHLFDTRPGMANKLLRPNSTRIASA